MSELANMIVEAYNDNKSMAYSILGESIVNEALREVSGFNKVLKIVEQLEKNKISGNFHFNRLNKLDVERFAKQENLQIFKPYNNHPKVEWKINDFLTIFLHSK